MTGIPSFNDFETELRERYGEPSTDIITVSGLTGTGTSTIASFLADMFDMQRFDAGHWFRKQAKKRGMDIHEFDKRTQEIEDEEGIDFDLEWDRTALRYAFTRDNFVLEGRLAGVLLEDIATVRVWVKCDPVVVAKRLTAHDDSTASGTRLADRENMSLEEAEDYVQERNEQVMQRYRKKYGINPRDETHYNVIVDNSNSFDEVKDDLVASVQDMLPS